MMKDVQRTAKYLGLSMVKTPSKFPLNTILAQRLLTVASKEDSCSVPSLSKALWDSYWTRDLDISNKEELKKACERAGLTPAVADRWLQQCDDDKIKKALIATTEEVGISGHSATLQCTSLRFFA